jgi:17beta-estradiol 17-dehydrogenase / very-long-chain 3-oxoacyl-CoA reductase
LVSGSSDGIGKEFALELAKKGYNVVIMARSKDKLKVVADEIKRIGVDCVIIPFDFSTTDDQQYVDLEQQLKKYDIQVLVNNVGISHEFPIAFLDEQPSTIERMMQVNIHSMMKMTRIVGTKMVSNKKGLILNIGSFSGKVPCGLLSVYAATKAFVKHWSMGLSMELKPFVHVEHINTYFVQTNMSKIKKSSLLVPTPKEYVKSVLGRVGGGFTSTPYWTHQVLDFVSDFVPMSLLMDQSFKLHVDIRKRALRKKERESASK